MQNDSKFQNLSTLGVTATPSIEERISAMNFVCMMYSKNACTSLNILRCEMATRNVLPKRMPPTENSFDLHLLRATYQLLIWRNAPRNEFTCPSAFDFGYQETKDGIGLEATLMNQTAAAPELLNNLFCECRKNLCQIDCICHDNDQPCTAICSCGGPFLDDCDSSCKNPVSFKYEDSCETSDTSDFDSE